MGMPFCFGEMDRRRGDVVGMDKIRYFTVHTVLYLNVSQMSQ